MKRWLVASFSRKRFALERPFALSTSQMGITIPGRSEQLERRWRLSASDRERWGKLRRSEALAALRVLGIHPSDVQFLALPDQGLTDLLLRDCNSALTRLIQVIDDWSPTDILAPSLSDIHPDHSAVAVMMRLIFADFLAGGVSRWNYLVHGRSPAFFDNAVELSSSEVRDRQQNAKQFAVIKRKSNCRGDVSFDTLRARSAFFVSNARALCGAMEPFIPFLEHAISSMWIFAFRLIHCVCKGTSFSFWVATRLGEHARARCVFPAARPILKCWIARRITALASPITGAIYLPANSTLPLDLFSPVHDLFVKVDRRSWFFDEAGWIEIPGVPSLTNVALSMISA